MGASNPNNVFLGAPSFTGGGYSIIQGGGILGSNAGTTLNVDGGLTHPLLQPAFDSELYLVNGEIGPLLTLLQNRPMRKILSHGNRYFWTEDRPMPERTTATGSTPIQGTSLGVAYGDMFMATDTVWIPDAGDAYGTVSSVTGNTLTMSWFAGCAPTVAITTNMVVYKLGNTQAEIAYPIPRPFTEKIQNHNTFQEFFYARQVSDRLKKEKWQIGTPLGSILPYEVEKMKRDAQVEGEKTLWFGQESWAAATGVGTLEGVYYSTGALRWDYLGNALVQADFEDFVDRGTRHRWGDLGEPVLFTSTMIQTQISRWAQPAQQLKPGDTRYGVQINEYLAPNGTKVPIVVNKLFDALGRDDLAIMLRMEPGAVAQIASLTYPNLTYQDFAIPFGGSWSEFGFKWRFSCMVKDARGHVNILENVGPSTATLI